MWYLFCEIPTNLLKVYWFSHFVVRTKHRKIPLAPKRPPPKRGMRRNSSGTFCFAFSNTLIAEGVAQRRVPVLCSRSTTFPSFLGFKKESAYVPILQPREFTELVSPDPWQMLRFPGINTKKSIVIRDTLLSGSTRTSNTHSIERSLKFAIERSKQCLTDEHNPQTVQAARHRSLSGDLCVGMS